MKLKVLLAAMVLGCLAIGVLTPGIAQGQGKAGKATVVGKDADNDWGGNVDPNIAPAGNALGQELVEASMSMADAKTVNFIIKVKSLPSTGGIPEFTRYGWDFSVDGSAMLISGARTEFIRTICYPLHSDPACPPNVGDPQTASNSPFMVREGACTVGTGGVADCRVKAVVESTFDPATGTITVPVPLEALGAKPGSKIEPLTNASFGGTIYAAPATVVASPNYPHDTLLVDKTFVIPKGKKK